MFDCLLLMAGSGKRTSLNYNKINYKINNKELYKYSLEVFLECKECHKVILVVKAEEYKQYEHLKNDRIDIVIGGKERFDSVYNGALAANQDIVLIHDAARCNIKLEEIIKVYQQAQVHKAVCLAVKAKDCIKMVQNSQAIETLDRSVLWQVQTPQAVNRQMLIQGLEKNRDTFYLDDVEVLEKNFNTRAFVVEGRYDNIKVTTDEDFKYMEFLLNKQPKIKIGHSKDTHKLVENRKLVLGGVTIPFHLGLLGHSDADVVYHAVCESIIGALGIGDIGTLFPDNDIKYKDIASSYFLEEVYKVLNDNGYIINNIDVTVYLEKPILKDYKSLMAQNIASLLHTDVCNVNVKATRGEGLGYIGRMEGISAEAICTIIQK